jgi:geranylgeranyl pyrophosphate synthase
VKARVRALPQVAAWPEMLDMIERAVHRNLQSVWELPFVACQALGGSDDDAVAGGAAVFCALTSIHLVDDMLDDDPRGDYHRLGVGITANLAFAFQAAAHCVLDEPPPAIPPERRAELHACLGRMALATSYGQHLDSREIAGEDEYWQVVAGKTPPLFGAALRLGALLAPAAAAADPSDTADGADVAKSADAAQLPTVADRLEQLGHTLGLFIQVSDDLADALQAPAGADWRRRANNLPMLYAMTADHPARQEFLAVSAAVDDAAALARAQQILVQCGAASYCAWKMIELSRQAHGLLAGLPLADPRPLREMLGEHLRPLEALLAAVGHDEPLNP